MRAAELVGLVAQRPGVPDGADLREVALEGQADRPVDYRAQLAEHPGDLTEVVGPGHPPGQEAGEGAAADAPDRLVAPEVDEAGLARVRVAAGLSDAELGGDVRSRHLRLADRVLGGGGREPSTTVGGGGAVADRPDALHALHREAVVDLHASAVI